MITGHHIKKGKRMKKIKENGLHSFNTDVAKQYGVDIAVLFFFFFY